MKERPLVLSRPACESCFSMGGLDFDFTMAFQPIINSKTKKIYGYEALVRGLNNESALSILSKVNQENRYLFDQLCRVKAIELASKLKLDSILSINFLPNAVYNPERCIRTTLSAAKKFKFPVERIIIEFTEVEKFDDIDFAKSIIECYTKLGFKTAIDDFGSGYAGLGLLADLQTNFVKLDMELIRNIDKCYSRQTIVRNSLNMFRDLNISPLAEGIETIEEYRCLRDFGIDLMQGFLFAKPGFESLPEVDFSQL